MKLRSNDFSVMSLSHSEVARPAAADDPSQNAPAAVDTAPRNVPWVSG